MSIPAFYIFLCAAFLGSLFVYNKLEPWFFKMCVPYLLMNLIAETYGLIIKSRGLKNYWIYNISTTLEFGFYFFIFFKILKEVALKKYIKITSLIFFPLCFINILFVQGINHFHSNTFLIGSIILISLCFFYFREQLRSEEIINPLKQKMFWISIGVMFFYLGGFFELGLFEFIHFKNPLIEKKFSTLLNVLNCFLYSMYLIAFSTVNAK